MMYKTFCIAMLLCLHSPKQSLVFHEAYSSTIVGYHLLRFTTNSPDSTEVLVVSRKDSASIGEGLDSLVEGRSYEISILPADSTLILKPERHLNIQTANMLTTIGYADMHEAGKSCASFSAMTR